MAKDKKKMYSGGLNLQKYTTVYPQSEGIATYTTNFAFGATVGVSFIIGGNTKTEL